MSKKIFIFTLSAALLTAFISCEIKSVSKTPVLSSITPSSKVVHTPSFTLTVKGGDFVSGAKIYFDSHEIPASFISPLELRATIPSEYISTSEAASHSLGSKTVEVYVKNPQGHDQSVNTESNHLNFTIKDNYSFGSPISAGLSTVLEAPELVIDKNDRLYLFYSKYDGLYFTYSSDLGSTWSQASKLDSGQPAWIKGYSEYSNTVNLAWARYGDNETGGFIFTRTADGGNTWSPVEKINTLNVSFGNMNILAGADGTLIAVWFAGYRWALLTVLTSRSTDHGATWSSVGQIAYGKDPYCVRSANGRIHMVFNYISGSSFDISYSASNDSGLSWIYPPYDISSGEKPVLAVDTSGNLYCFYLDPSNYNLNLRKSINGGSEWGAPLVISPAGKGLQAAAVTDSLDNLNSVFAGSISEETDSYRTYSGINFMRSVDDGATWSGPVQIIGTQKAMGGPGIKAVMTSGGYVIAAWAEADKDTLNNVTIKIAKSDN